MATKKKAVEETAEEKEIEEVTETVEETTETTEEKVVEETVEEKTAEEKTKLTAIKTFKDKITDTIYPKGTVFTVVNEDIETKKIKGDNYKISSKRAEELINKKVVE